MTFKSLSSHSKCGIPQAETLFDSATRKYYIGDEDLSGRFKKSRNQPSPSNPITMVKRLSSCIEIDAASVRSATKALSSSSSLPSITSDVKSAVVTACEHQASSAMMEHDHVVMRPPGKKYTVKVKFKEIRKGRPGPFIKDDREFSQE